VPLFNALIELERQAPAFMDVRPSPHFSMGMEA
jgi:hypothetical protein